MGSDPDVSFYTTSQLLLDTNETMGSDPDVSFVSLQTQDLYNSRLANLGDFYYISNFFFQIIFGF